MTPQIKQRIEQIRRGEVPKGYKKTKVGLVPEEWEIKKLSDISNEIKEVAGTGKYETLSISAGIGFVNQANKFGKELSGKQYEKYTVLRKGDFAYNKGNSKKYPQGCIYRLKDRDSAAVPNVFECFRIKEGNKNYIEQVFISGFLNRQLSKKINHGVRDDGLLNLTGEDFYKSYIIIPPLPEQEKIAEILQTQDKVIELQQKKIDELKKLKKVYLSKMFPKKGCNVPEIRFLGFTDPWEQRKFGEITSKYEDPVPTPHDGYYRLGIRSHAKGTFHSYVAKGQELETAQMHRVAAGNFIVNITFGWEHAVAITDKNDAGKLVSHRFPQFSFAEGMVPEFFRYVIVDEKFRHHLWLASPGGAGRNRVLKLDEMLNYLMRFPSRDEQIKIAEFFRHLDNLITLHQRKLEEEQKKKKALMQLLLTGIVRT